MRCKQSLFTVVTLTLFLLGCSTTPNKPLPHAAIASAHPLATQAGFQILDEGGNAFDAAIAVAATLAVVEPYSAGMGGGGFWMLHVENSDSSTPPKQVMIDAREMAPGAAHRDMYLDAEGNVDRDKAINGPLAAGIPGQAAAFAHLAENYGALPLSQSLAPAIHIANEGFPVYELYRSRLNMRQQAIKRYPYTAALFLDGGEIPALNTLIKQTDLAHTLTLLAEKGFDGFYRGEVAEKLVAGAKTAGGIWTLDDLANYQIKERAPLIGNYRHHTIIAPPPPSSGGVALITILNQLEPYRWESMPEVQQIHLITEAMRRAYRDRAIYLGDSDFVDVPVKKLISKENGDQWRNSIDLNHATASKDLGEPVAHQEGHHTTHFSVLDQEGNRVSATLSINLPFGSAFAAPGTGVLFNNEMDDFSAKPGAPNAYGLVGNEANAIEPGKRPLSSMTPIFIESEDQVAILGTPGGSRIITMVLLGALEFFQGKEPEEWVSRPRFHHQYLPDTIQYEENAFSKDVLQALQELGHNTKNVGRQYGNMQAILWNKDNQSVTAASDPRGVGQALVK